MKPLTSFPGHLGGGKRALPLFLHSWFGNEANQQLANQITN